VNVCFHYFPCLPDDAPPPTSSSSSPASRPASLHRRTPLRPVATEVRTAASSLLWTPRPSSRGGMPAAPRHRAAAGDAGHRARLGCNFLQVPPSSPTRARHPPSQHPLAVGRRPVLVAAAPCRRVRVAFTSCARSRARPCGPRRPRTGVHPSTSAPQPWRRGRAFGPLFCLRRRSPPCLGRPRRRDPVVAMWVACTVPKGRGRHVLGRPEHTAETPSRLRQPTAGAVLAAAHGDESGSAVHPVRVPSRPTPSPSDLHPLGLTLRTRYPAPHTRPLWARAPTLPPRRRRRARADAGLTATSTSPS
jgi:hypothetical protein